MAENKERNQEIVKMFLDGKTYAEIGARFGISAQRVQIIVKQAGGRLVPVIVEGGASCKLAR